MKFHRNNGAHPPAPNRLAGSLPKKLLPPPHLFALAKVAQDVKKHKIKYGCGFKACDERAKFTICTEEGQQTLDTNGGYKTDPTVVFACNLHIGLFKNLSADRICRLPKD